MRHSIKARFAMIFVGLMAFVLIATWCVNNWFLESFYTMDKVATLEKAYNGIDRIVTETEKKGTDIFEYFKSTYDPNRENEGPVQQMFRVLGEKYNMNIVLMDSATDQVLISNTGERDYLSSRVQGYIFGKDMPKVSILKTHDNYFIQKTYDKRSDSYYLESWGYFSDNATIFLMSTPLASIRESVDLANRFLAYVGIAALFVGSVFIYFTTKKITSPILQLANLSEKMSNLDFDAKYTGQAEDEIGVLGNSMNRLSDTLKETIGQLRTANTELQQDIEEKIKVDEMRKDFIANVSHELRTPLTAINGWAETIMNGEVRDAEDVKKGMGIIVSEARRLTNMVEELLEFSRIEDGRFTLSIEPMDIKAELEDAVYTYTEFFRREGITLTHTDCDEEFPPIPGDPERMRQVFCNLLDNAAKHGGSGKRIETAIRPGADNDVVITIRDYGPGIPADELPHVKYKFYKGSSKARGSGIGLAVCEEIVTRHNGRLDIGNAEGGGCIVTIRLPIGNTAA